MNSFRHTAVTGVTGLAFAFAFSACNPTPSVDTATRAESPAAIVAPPKCSNCGTITSIEEVKAKGSGSGVGAVAGAVVGAVVGHQVGDGRGKDVATAAGAIGGGVAGNEIERRSKSTISYRVSVAMEDGGTRSIETDTLNGLSTGSRVKVNGDSLQSY